MAALLCAATFLLKLLVPTGYMIDNTSGHVSIIVCSGFGPATGMTDMPGMHDDMPDHSKSQKQGKAEMPCTFSGLSAALLLAQSDFLIQPHFRGSSVTSTTSLERIVIGTERRPFAVMLTDRTCSGLSAVRVRIFESWAAFSRSGMPISI